MLYRHYGYYFQAAHCIPDTIIPVCVISIFRLQVCPDFPELTSLLKLNNNEPSASKFFSLLFICSFCILVPRIKKVIHSKTTVVRRGLVVVVSLDFPAYIYLGDQKKVESIDFCQIQPEYITILVSKPGRLLLTQISKKNSRLNLTQTLPFLIFFPRNQFITYFYHSPKQTNIEYNPSWMRNRWRKIFCIRIKRVVVKQVYLKRDTLNELWH